ncbi:MAG: B-box zinc finger protein [Candidatus Acidiferrales bacterium]
MKCAVHPEVDAIGFCRNCGKALCPGCSREVRGMIYCESCLADMVTAPRSATETRGSAGMATFLGFIPGLGAVYNEEYIKAIVHVCVFISIIGILVASNSDLVHTFFGISLGFFVLYMAVDANRSFKARLRGQVPSDSQMGSARMIGPLVLIALGFIFLLENFHILDFDRLIDNWWPLLLIGAGGLLAWRQLGEKK